MTAPYVALFEGLRRRADAAARLEPLDHTGERDPGPGVLPRRDRIAPPERPRPPSPHLQIALYARAGRMEPPPGATLADLRAAWTDRPDIRTALAPMAAHLTDSNQENTQ